MPADAHEHRGERPAPRRNQRNRDDVVGRLHPAWRGKHRPTSVRVGIHGAFVENTLGCSH
eukprot:5096237-Prymnesium_polylepis.1